MRSRSAHKQNNGLLIRKALYAFMAVFLAVCISYGALAAQLGDSDNDDPEADESTSAEDADEESESAEDREEGDQADYLPGRELVTVHVDGDVYTVDVPSLSEATLEDVGGYTLDDQDYTELVENDYGYDLYVHRMTDGTYTEEIALAYDTVRVADDTLPEGTEEVTTPGEDGVRVDTYEVTYRYGEPYTKLVDSEIVSMPVTQVVSYGTKAADDVETSADVISTVEAQTVSVSASPSAADSSLDKSVSSVTSAVSAESSSAVSAASENNTSSSASAPAEEPAKTASADGSPASDSGSSDTASSASSSSGSGSLSRTGETIVSVDTGSQTFTTSGGAVYSYSQALSCKAYAYTSNGGTTASGTSAREGVIAVDPSVIPLGSRVFIVTSDGSVVYGVAAAEDTGSNIKGNTVDLYYNSSSQCSSFGSRSVTVYILN